MGTHVHSALRSSRRTRSLVSSSCSSTRRSPWPTGAASDGAHPPQLPAAAACGAVCCVGPGPGACRMPQRCARHALLAAGGQHNVLTSALLADSDIVQLPLGSIVLRAIVLIPTSDGYEPRLIQVG